MSSKYRNIIQYMEYCHFFQMGKLEVDLKHRIICQEMNSKKKPVVKSNQKEWSFDGVTGAL